MKHLENTLSCQIKQCGMHTFCFLRLMSYVQPKTRVHESTLHGVLGLSRFLQTHFLCTLSLRTYFMRVIFLHTKGIAKDLSSWINVTWSIRVISFSAILVFVYTFFAYIFHACNFSAQIFLAHWLYELNIIKPRLELECMYQLYVVRLYPAHYTKLG